VRGALERGGPRSRAGRTLERGGARSREAHPLERGGAYPEGGAHPRARRNLFEGVFEWAAWWAAGAFVAWAMSCMVK
jgi:hypothetical protein